MFLEKFHFKYAFGYVSICCTYKSQRMKIKWDHMSRFSLLMTSTSRATVDLDPTLYQASQVCNSSRKVHGHVQSSTITTAAWGRADCSCRKCGTRAVYKGAEVGTVDG